MTEYRWTIAGAVRIELPFAMLWKHKIAIPGATPPELLAAARELPGLPAADFGDFRRGDEKVRLHLTGALLAFYDAGLAPAPDTAVLEYSREGCHEQNKRYWSDYLAFGRRTGRGHLFVGTLPSTPLCECAIAFGCHGPAYYLDTLGRDGTFFMEIQSLFDGGEASRVLAFHTEGLRTHVFVFTSGKSVLPDGISPDGLFSLPPTEVT